VVYMAMASGWQAGFEDDRLALVPCVGFQGIDDCRPTRRPRTAGSTYMRLISARPGRSSGWRRNRLLVVEISN
jgi:hypothetical protein